MTKLPRPKSQSEELFALQLRAEKIDFLREYRFDVKRRWRFDFAIPLGLIANKTLAVEIDGGTWSNGRHNRGSGFEKDRERDAAAMMSGWRVLRVTTNQVKSGKALEWVKALIE
jgi:very-short-patch-repair endonuclease